VVSVRFDPDRGKFVVRWRDGGGRRCRRFDTESDAIAFDAYLVPRVASAGPNADSATRPLEARIARLEARHSDKTRGGVYAYAAKQGVQWRIVFRQSDGTMSSRRGFRSRTAAVTARRRLQEAVDRGEVKGLTRELRNVLDPLRRGPAPYMTAGSHLDLTTHGRKRLVPFFGADPARAAPPR
jgi:hypothetical protein